MDMVIKSLDIHDVQPNPLQPREHFDRDKLQELALSLKSVDMLSPIIVRPKGKKYEIIAGERRWKAAQIAGFKKIQALVKTGVDDTRLMLESLIENTHREDLTALEKAKAIKNVKKAIEKQDGETITIAKLAKILGMSQKSVEDHLSILPKENEIRHVEKSAAGASLPISATRAIVEVEDRGVRDRLYREVIQGKRTAKEIEEMVPIIKKASQPIIKALINKEIESDYCKNWSACRHQPEGRRHGASQSASFPAFMGQVLHEGGHSQGAGTCHGRLEKHENARYDIWSAGL